MNDQKLFQKCKMYGKNALIWRNKFLGLLPQVWRRRLFEKKGYNSIFEFASKLAGVSQEQVRLVLNLEYKFQDKPALHNLLISGEASVNKLARVVSIASIENQEELAEHVKNLSSRALETFVRDEKHSSKQEDVFQNFNGLVEPHAEQNGLHVQEKYQIILDDGGAEIKNGKSQQTDKSSHESATNNINLDLELIQKLSPELKQRLIKFVQKGINVDRLLNELLDRHDQQIKEVKAQIVNKYSTEADLEGNKGSQISNLSATSRYIPVKIRRILEKEHGEKCAVPDCFKNSEHIHHAGRFAVTRSHNPFFLAPLCREHHEIAHKVDLKYFKRLR